MMKTWRVLLAIAPLFVGACHRGDGGDPDFGGVDFGTETFSGPQPVFGTTVSQQKAPPPISGGTLLVSADGKTAIASDPDRDHIYVVDLSQRRKIADLSLQAGDEPGRAVTDGAGRVHVVLRGGGAFVTIDPSTWTISARRNVCAAPRGIAWDPTGDFVHVACAGGELVSFPSASGDATRMVSLARDLRDVVVMNGTLYVSRFRSAELLRVDASGSIVNTNLPSTAQSFNGGTMSPAAAWRLVPLPEADTIYMLHQRGSDDTIDVQQPGGYGGFGGDPCEGSIVGSTVTPVIDGQPAPQTPTLQASTLAVDLAYSPERDEFAVAVAGNAYVSSQPTVVTFPRYTYASLNTNSSTCTGNFATLSGSPQIEPIAVAYAGGAIVVQSREPSELVFSDGSVTIQLSSDSKADTGHAVFHSNAGGGVACASCHLEGGEDGRVWSFDTVGPRRTQSIRGGILGTEPFHWDGTEKAFPNIMSDVFVHRMSGPTLASDQIAAMQSWVNAIPALAQSVAPDAAAVTRGQALFEDAENVGCTSCHSGPKLTNNATVDVGTGGMFQVPSLRGVAWRPPYLHDGRAPTLADRFSSIGGGDQHGHTSQLTPDQINDLVSYLSTL